MINNGLIKSRSLLVLGVVLGIVLLPACDWFGKKEAEKPAAGEVKSGEQVKEGEKVAAADGATVLAKMGDKTLITMEEFEKDFEQLLQENQQLKQLLPFMPDVKKNFLTGLVNQRIIDRYVKDNQIDQKAEYKKDLERMYTAAERMLNTRYFADAYSVQVTDDEVKAFYEANKDKMQELVISQGGIQTIGISFNKEADAKAFLTKAQAKPAQFAQIAKQSNLAVQDFKLVNKQTVGMDPKLKNKIVTMEKVPAVEFVKLDEKLCWVIYTSKKEEPKYREFEKVKAPLAQVVEGEKKNKILQQKLEELKVSYNIQIDDAKLRPQQQQQPDVQVAAQDEEGKDEQPGVEVATAPVPVTTA